MAALHPRPQRALALAGVMLALMSAGAPRAHAQSSVLARCADGQAWVSWVEDSIPPLSYAIYRSSVPFTSTNQATLVGRLFRYEWLPEMVALQTSGRVTGWRIPNGLGGQDTLPPGRGLFVDTVHLTGTRYYAVVRHGDTVVTAANSAGPVAWVADPADPPECHLQDEYVLAGQWLVRTYVMWCDGRNNEVNARPDFPVAANQYKNGMPALFIVSRPLALGPGLHPITYWFHGGQGEARQSLPTTRKAINLDPGDGYLVAHHDDMPRWIPELGFMGLESSSWWFGWTRDHDPFDSTFTQPGPGDTIVNYTQRRLLWIHDWLLTHEPIDPARASLQGHSVGSAGAAALGKAHPGRWSSVTLFNPGLLGPEPEAEIPGQTVAAGVNLFGSREDDLPTTLVREGGEVVPIYQCFDLTHRTAPTRDLPLFRVLHGKRDENSTMAWDAGVVGEYRAADSLALGAQLYWDERAHSVGADPVHWTLGDLPTEQTVRDDVAYQARYRSDQSYPAFFDHRLDPTAHDPGDGTRGIVGDPAWSGDDWGTWGGWHEWEPDSIVDTPTAWSCPAWLIHGAIAPMDDCPYDSLTAGVAIRRPQQFVPAPGTAIYWCLTSAGGDTLQDGTTYAGPDGLVRADGIVLERAPELRTIRFSTVMPLAAPAPPGATSLALAAAPLPVRDHTRVRFQLPRAGPASVSVHDVAGRSVATLARGAHRAGAHELSWRPGALPPGIYLVRLETADGTRVVRIARVR